MSAVRRPLVNGSCSSAGWRPSNLSNEAEDDLGLALTDDVTPRLGRIRSRGHSALLGRRAVPARAEVLAPIEPAPLVLEQEQVRQRDLVEALPVPRRIHGDP